MHNNMLHHLSNLITWTDWWWETQNTNLVQKNNKFIAINVNIHDYEIFCFQQLHMKLDCFAIERSDFEQVSIWKSINSMMLSFVHQYLFCWHFYSFFKLESAFCSLNLMLAYCRFHQQIVRWPGKVIIALCFLRALSSTEPGQLAQGQPRASPESVQLAQRARG